MSIKRGRVIKVAEETKAAFERSFTKGDGTAKAANIRQVNVPVFNGQTFPNDGRGHNTATLLVNFDKMSNYGGKSAYLGSAGPSDAELAGKSDAEVKAMLSPVYVEEYTDLREADPTKAEKVRMSIDPVALGNANYQERVKNQKEGAPTPNPESAKRLPIKLGFTTTHKGVSGMSVDSFTANVAKAAQQRYVLTASAKEPSKGVPTPEDIRTIGKIFAEEYDKFAKTAMTSGCKGIKSKVRNDKGEMVNGPVIEGTTFDALSKTGLEYKKIGDATVIGGAANGKSSSDINKAFVAFNNAFNAHMSQVINGNDSLSADAKRLGNMMGVNSYAVIPPHEGTGRESMILIQPSATADMQPFTGALQKAYDCAMHEPNGGPNPPGGGSGIGPKTPEELYGAEILENAQNITKPFEKSSLSREAAKAVQEEQYAAVATELNVPEVSGDQFSK